MDAAVGRYVPYVGLAIGAALTPLVVTATPVQWLVTAGWVAAAVAWSAVFTFGPLRGVEGEGGACHRGEPASRPALGAVYVAGFVVLMAVLVVRSPFFAFSALAGYAHSWEYLRGRWRFVGISAVGVLAAYGQLGGPFVELTPVVLAGWALVAVLNAGFASLFTYMNSLTVDQSLRRGEVIEELHETNRRLAETLEENAELHARLLTQAREAGISDERARMAREIHDTIAQGLTGVVTQLEAAGAAGGDAHTRHLATAAALARESLTEARRSVAALAPGRLADAQLPDAVADMAKAWAETAGVDVRVEVTGEPRALLPDIEVALFRVAQEALANVGRHAGATRAGITLSYMDDVVVLDVVDDGCGFDPAAVTGPSEGSGFGMGAMEQRVRRVSGMLEIESTPGEGTAVSASVPAIPVQEEGT
ncbi:sensor histidine kinase [Pseudonocardia abyssalis]|uniref:Sensor histidine kinase n=1 Tax=Pseudonocardia abyssalis TaxID=2792008 RepID=A0ABS6UT50_9PSEU|nr:sensor histidine kinase [Pseudonocardia abyssalis]